VAPGVFKHATIDFDTTTCLGLISLAAHIIGTKNLKWALASNVTTSVDAIVEKAGCVT
jgi:hypothetical protein